MIFRFVTRQSRIAERHGSGTQNRELTGTAGYVRADPWFKIVKFSCMLLIFNYLSQSLTHCRVILLLVQNNSPILACLTRPVSSCQILLNSAFSWHSLTWFLGRVFFSIPILHKNWFYLFERDSSIDLLVVASDLEADCQLFPKTISNSVRFRHSPEWPDTPNLEKSISQSSGCVLPSWVVSLTSTIGFDFSHWWAFTWGHLLTSFWHDTLLSAWIRKTITQMPRREHFENHDVKQTRNVISFISWETSRVRFGCPLIWFALGSKFNLSKSQSRATLWVLDTCLIVGLLVIFMTTSLSSKRYDWDSPWEECVSGHKIHIRQLINFFSPLVIQGLGFVIGLARVPFVPLWLGWTALLVERNTSITLSQRSKASNPSIRCPASREMISDSLELCETDLCFLHIQLTGTNVPLPKKDKTPPEVDFESSRSSAKSESWNQPSRQCCAVFPTWQYCRNSFGWWM